MLNHIWFAMIILAVLIAGGIDFYNEVLAVPDTTVETEKPRNLNEETKLGQVTSAALGAAQTAVEIAIGLIGIMALWLGMMKIAEQAGLTAVIARQFHPTIRPSVP